MIVRHRQEGPSPGSMASRRAPMSLEITELQLFA